MLWRLFRMESLGPGPNGRARRTWNHVFAFSIAILAFSNSMLRSLGQHAALYKNRLLVHHLITITGLHHTSTSVSMWQTAFLTVQSPFVLSTTNYYRNNQHRALSCRDQRLLQQCDMLCVTTWRQSSEYTVWIAHSPVGMSGVGDPHFGAVNDVLVALLFAFGLHSGDIGSCSWLSDGVRLKRDVSQAYLNTTLTATNGLSIIRPRNLFLMSSLAHKISGVWARSFAMIAVAIPEHP